MPSQEQCSKPIEMTSTVSELLPTDVGPGVCCTALLFYLVNANNDMVEAYQGAVGSDESTRYVEFFHFNKSCSNIRNHTSLNANEVITIAKLLTRLKPLSLTIPLRRPFWVLSSI